jgi:glycopeptide antibiotics resistance protein
MVRAVMTHTVHPARRQAPPAIADMPPRFLHPFLPYRSFLAPIFIVCAVVVPCWLLFRLYRRRSRAHRLSFPREILLLTFVAYLAGLAAVTLSPNRSSRLLAEGRGGVELNPNLASLTCSSAVVPTGSSVPPFCKRNAAGNFALFFPFGILLPLVWARIRFWKGMQIAVALSFGIELLQYLSSAWGSYRAVDVNDFILNVFGASLGLALVSLLRSGREALPAYRRA